MILARLSKAIREQNWFAVAIEFVIVILGVVIGFQITAWNVKQQDVLLEREYLQRLEADLAASEELLSEDINNLRQWHRQALNATEALISGDQGEISDFEFSRALVFGGRLQFVRGQYGTIDELISTGRMRLIRNSELRTLITRTTNGLEELDRLNALIGERQNALVPFYRTRMLILNGFGEDTDVIYDFDELAADEEFLNAFGNVTHLMTINIMWLEGARDLVRELHAGVRAELGMPAVSYETSAAAT
ncbi:hypothetical protein V0U79_10780 [Hyphobacterium sp. HN65]|uniref:Uncharacterized protein n=1 Tax=Hyphobacterium lacteum TaxID=3116575 RepID=A0ABU7LSG3_9PROT|nr:hypothetical protein [Hyphobacterium sp. HN65]MEE2526856.1 hypothetical protein [Hyphobacterium sp. HN65]